MDPDLQQYISFIISFGQYEFVIMPFGLKQASGWFQLLMNDVLYPLIAKTVIIYLDDIVIYTKGSLEQYIKNVKEILKLI